MAREELGRLEDYKPWVACQAAGFAITTAVLGYAEVQTLMAGGSLINKVVYGAGILLGAVEVVDCTLEFKETSRKINQLSQQNKST
jgi:hypothetical protein